MQTPQPTNSRLYTGQVVYIYAFDLAYDMKRQQLPELLGEPIQDYCIGPSKRSPKQLFFYRPQMVVLPPVLREGPAGTVEIRRSIKIFNIGAVSIQFCVPFGVDKLEDLVAYHDLDFVSGPVRQEASQLAEQALNQLRPYCVRAVPYLGPPEDYTVFCLYQLPQAGNYGIHAEDWLKENTSQVAALLTQEQDAAHLSAQEAAESTQQYLTYYYSDLVVVDWDAALVVGEQDSLNDILHIMELANVQLVELEAYDRLLDASLDAVYRDLAKRSRHVSRQIQQNLREIRVDLARLSDELLNITKFFGDWHLARIYRNLSGRFHLADWHGIMREKLKTLGDLYQLLQQDSVNFWMVLLETTIVLLFIIDVVLLLTRS